MSLFMWLYVTKWKDTALAERDNDNPITSFNHPINKRQSQRVSNMISSNVIYIIGALTNQGDREVNIDYCSSLTFPHSLMVVLFPVFNY